MSCLRCSSVSDEGWDHPARQTSLPLPSVEAAIHPSLELNVLGWRVCRRHYHPGCSAVHPLSTELFASQRVVGRAWQPVDQSTIDRWVQRFVPLLGGLGSQVS